MKPQVGGYITCQVNEIAESSTLKQQLLVKIPQAGGNTTNQANEIAEPSSTEQQQFESDTLVKTPNTGATSSNRRKRSLSTPLRSS